MNLLRKRLPCHRRYRKDVATQWKEDTAHGTSIDTGTSAAHASLTSPSCGTSDAGDLAVAHDQATSGRRVRTNAWAASALVDAAPVEAQGASFRCSHPTLTAVPESPDVAVLEASGEAVSCIVALEVPDGMGWDGLSF